MKLRFFFIAIVTASIFYSCATTGEPAPMQVVEETEKAEAVTEEVSTEPVKIVTTVFFPVREDIYFGDGTRDEYRIYTYNNGGVSILREELFGSDDKLSEYSEYEYNGTDSFVKRNYDSAGRLLSYTINNTDSMGNITRVENYNGKDQLQSRSDYEYSDGLKTKWSVYGSSMNLLSETDYKYKDGKLIRIESISSGGDLEEYFSIDYNSDGLAEKNVHYSASGEIEDSRSFEYENGFLTLERFHRKNGSVKRKIMYVNDKNGNPVETVYMDAGSNVSERIVRTYESREEISYEN